MVVDVDDEFTARKLDPLYAGAAKAAAETTNPEMPLSELRADQSTGNDPTFAPSKVSVAQGDAEGHSLRSNSSRVSFGGTNGFEPFIESMEV
jgi:hypothetical protein